MPEDSDSFGFHERAVVVKFNDGIVRGRKKADEEIRQGDDLSRDGTGWKDRRMRFDETGDQYEETVIDLKTGGRVHHDAEPLSQKRARQKLNRA